MDMQIRYLYENYIIFILNSLDAAVKWWFNLGKNWGILNSNIL